MSGAHRSGSVVITGRPNVGKSTLFNALVGQTLSIVTPKAQTTRHRIQGVVTREGWQLALLDVPGAGRAAGSRLAQAMKREAAAALAGADAAILVVAAPRWNAGDSAALAALRAAGLPVVLAVNKIDLVRPRERLLPLLEDCAGRHEFAAIVPVSAARAENLDRLERAVASLLPEAPAAWPADAVTDRSERFIAAEALREQLMIALSDELPYGIAVEIERFEDRADGRTEIDAVIWVERPGQRRIVIGTGGARLKAIGRAARLALNQRLGRRVHLSTWVRVQKGWSDDPAMLRRLGHESP
ncbi:MAG: GTPase Era [Gammaproteobacteria bacterium]